MPLTRQRLQRLVAYRERLERQQEQAFARAVQEMTVRERAVAERVAKRRELLASGGPGRGPVDPRALMAAVDYRCRLDREIAARKAAVAHSATLVEAERERLLAVRRERRAMEVLLERRIEQERLERSRAEAAAIDEAAITRWQRE